MAIPYPVISVVIWPWQGFSIFLALNRLWNSTHRINSRFFKKNWRCFSCTGSYEVFVPVTVPLCAGPAPCPSGRAPSHPCPWRPPPLSPGLHEPHGVSRLPLLSHSPFLHYIMLIRSRTASCRSREILLLQQQHQPCVVCVEQQQHQHCGCIDSAGQPRLKRTPTNTPRSLEQGASTGIDSSTWVLSYLGCCMETNQRLYMSHFAYACKTEGKNGISRLISGLCVNCLISILEYSRLNHLDVHLV